MRPAIPLPSPQWTLAVKNVFLPIFCNSCGIQLLTEDNGFFCPQCWEQSPRIERPFCTLCGRPHEVGTIGAMLSGFPCAQCRTHPLPHVGRIWAPAVYDGALAQAVKLLKFHGKERLARLLAEEMAAFAEKELPLEDYHLLVPVPLHRVRLRERGFNQSKLLAAALLPLFPQAALSEALYRIRPTRVQSRLKGKDRIDSVKGAFAVEGNTCHGLNALLIDDVVTTGGTASECARALQRAGASRVDVFAAALAMPDTHP